MFEGKSHKEKAIIKSVAQLRSSLNKIPAYIYIKNRKFLYSYANKKVLDLFGATEKDIIGSSDRNLFSRSVARQLRKTDRQVLKGYNTIEEITIDNQFCEQRIYLDVKTPIRPPTDNRSIIGILGIATDITDWKKRAMEMYHFAHTDPLTKLANRRLLLKHIDIALRRSKRKNSYGALLFVDLNKFKEINDVYGHDVGDQVLIEVGRHLCEQVRENDVVARIGGDEFIILLEEIGTRKEQANRYVCEVRKRIEKKLSEKYLSPSLCLKISASIGIQLFLSDVQTPDEILHEADVNMYERKKASRS